MRLTLAVVGKTLFSADVESEAGEIGEALTAILHMFNLLMMPFSEYLEKLGADGSDAAFRSIIPHIQFAHIEGAGHMLHIEKADLVAPLIENFLSAH